MSDGDPVPTFAGWSDRLTWLLGQFRLLISVIIGVGILAALWIGVSIPLPTVPTWAWAFLVANIIFAIPFGLIGSSLVGYLRDRQHVDVYVVNAEDDRVQGFSVPPETWAAKNVEGPDPTPVNGGDAWLVREFEYQEDTGELYVSGSWPSEINDMEWYTSQARIEQIHGWMTSKLRELIGVRELVSRISLQVQEKLVNQQAEARERGTMMDPEAVADALDDVKDELPDFDPGDIPSLDDALDEEDAPHLDLSPDPEPAVRRIDDNDNDPNGLNYE